MQITQEIIDQGLLAELAYLKLEDAYWSTPDKNGKLPSYSNLDDLDKFLTGTDSKDNPYTTGIDDSRDQDMLELLSHYTIDKFVTMPSGMQAMVLIKNDGSGITVAFRGTETSDKKGDRLLFSNHCSHVKRK